MILFLQKIMINDFEFEIVNFPFLDSNTVGQFAFLFNCTLVGRTSDSMMVPT